MLICSSQWESICDKVSVLFMFTFGFKNKNLLILVVLIKYNSSVEDLHDKCSTYLCLCIKHIARRSMKSQFQDIFENKKQRKRKTP